MAADTGDTIAERYQLNEKLGEDEFGSRFLGEDKENSQQVLVKILAPRMHVDDAARGRFVREIELLSKIQHPGIVKVLEAGDDDGSLYLVSEYEEGIDLENYLQNQGIIGEKDAVNLLLNIVEALKHVWNNDQIVHRDIKPNRIFITDDNKVKLSDLGLAKSTTDDTMDLTGAGFTVGTPDYISPEQAGGEELDFRADMYSLGLVLYQMVTGKKAFEGPVMEVLNKQMTEMPPSPSEVNSKVTSRCSTLIEKMIAKSKDKRFKSWAELIEAMHLLLDTTVMESDLQVFDMSDLTDGEDEPSFESLTADDDGAFGAPAVNASGIIMEEDVADNYVGPAEEITPEVDAIEPGTIIGNGYEIDRKVGDGSMGEIFLAFSEESDKLVQIKVLPAHMTSDQEKVERFLQEIKITSTLSHPNLLSVIEAGEDNGRYYLVTEYEEGISYHDYIGRYGPLHERDALSFLAQIAEVLNYAWKEKKLLHREIKPENILIKEDSKEAKLTDFGVAKPMTDEALNLTGMGFTIGTPDYMSPEQVRGDEDLDARSDMYALGLVLYESLTKKKPFEADNVMALMNKQMVEAHEPISKVNSKVSKNCSDLIDKLLDKDRENRFESWDELIKAMRNVADGGTFSTKVDLPEEKSSPVEEKAAPKEEEKPKSSSPKPAPKPMAKPTIENPAEKGSNTLLIVGVVVVVAVAVGLYFAFK